MCCLACLALPSLSVLSTGGSRLLKRGDKNRHEHLCTLPFCAPEALFGSPSEAADAYSFGKWGFISLRLKNPIAQGSPFLSITAHCTLHNHERKGCRDL
jgi:hypothetical protein